MNILVTGGLGNIGQFVVAHLLQNGYGVLVIDYIDKQEIRADVADQIRGAEYRQVDVRDFETVRTCCEDIDAVVHMAGIPFLVTARSAEIFHINAGGTFNIYQAAAEKGIKRVIAASSINILGNGFGIDWIDVEYFPIDEAHPGYSTDAYAFSKQTLESIAFYFWRCAGITSVCLRFPLVFGPLWPPVKRPAEHLRLGREAYEALMVLPEVERQVRVSELKDSYLQMRQQRSLGEITFDEIYQFLVTTPGAMLLFRCENFWTAVDVRDAARSIEQALLAECEGCHPVYVADTHNHMGLPTRDLTALIYPNVQTWKSPVRGTEALLNIDKARALLGFEPEYSINRVFQID